MSLNVVAMVGRLVADPELRQTTTGKEVVTFRIAVDRPYSKDANAQKSDFFTVVAWNSTALFVSRYFSKGSEISIRGKLQSRNYEDGNGDRRTAIEILAEEVSFCGSKNQGTAPTQTAKPSANENANGFATASYSDFEGIGDDDDLPFG